MRVIIFLAFLLSGLALADDATEASAAVHEYFRVFNAKDVEKIANDIYLPPVLIGGGETHRIYDDVETAVESLGNTYQQFESLGWKESVIADTKTCILTDDLALVDTRFSRMTDDGKTIPPDIRTTLYALKKVQGEWRIIAFFGHDPERRLSCVTGVDGYESGEEKW